MPIFQRAIKTIQHADDGPGTLGAGQDTEALTWDNGTGKFVMSAVGGGGGNVAYTDARNTFLHQQIFQASVDDLELGDELLSNGGFDTDLTGWTPSDGDWSVSGGAAIHTPGASATLTQDVTGVGEAVYVLEITVSGITAGSVQISDSENISKTITANGTYKAIDYLSLSTDTITISVSSDFDGQIDSISFKQSMNGFPPSLSLRSADGSPVSEFRTFNGSMFAGLGAGAYCRVAGNASFGNYSLDSIVNQSGNTSFGDGSGSGALCNDGLFLGAGIGAGETRDAYMHIGVVGDMISGQMAYGDASAQTLKFHARICNYADVPTDPTGLNPGDLYNDGGFAKFA